MSRRLLAATLGGALLGLALALLLQAAIARTATPLRPERARWQLVLLASAGGLAGFALSAVSVLQATATDPAYHRSRRPWRPSSGARDRSD